MPDAYIEGFCKTAQEYGIPISITPDGIPVYIDRRSVDRVKRDDAAIREKYKDRTSTKRLLKHILIGAGIGTTAGGALGAVAKTHVGRLAALSALAAFGGVAGGGLGLLTGTTAAGIDMLREDAERKRNLRAFEDRLKAYFVPHTAQ